MSYRALAMGFCAALSLALSACVTAPTPRGSTASAIRTELETEDPHRVAAAIDQVRANPGGYIPPIFGRVAAALYARGDHAEALLWMQFGLTRLAVDRRYIIAGREPTESGIASMVLGSYGESLGEELLGYYRALPQDAALANFDEAERLDGATPRLYPQDWIVRGPDYGFDVNWVENPVTWPAEALSQHAAMRAAHVPRMRAQVEAESAEQDQN